MIQSNNRPFKNKPLSNINELKVHAGENFSIKQMEKTRKTLETKLEKLRSDERKDDVITFEPVSYTHLDVYKRQAPMCSVRSLQS